MSDEEGRAGPGGVAGGCPAASASPPCPADSSLFVSFSSDSSGSDSPRFFEWKGPGRAGATPVRARIRRLVCGSFEV